MFNLIIACKMAKTHDEMQDARLLSRKGIIDYSAKTINLNHNLNLGNKSWGRIDFLCHYCGWVVVYNSGFNAFMNKAYTNSESKTNAREAKKASKEHKLTDKRNRNTKTK